MGKEGVDKMNLLEEAIIYSTVLYQGKTRKISGSPYILHPLEVAQILSTMTDDLEVIAAGVMHDIVEDTDGTIEEIRKRFGERVAMLVDSETENDYPGEDKAQSWKKRKSQSLDKLKSLNDIGVKMLWLADKLSNIRSLAGSFGEYGDKVWEKLNQKDSNCHLWYYKTIAEYVEMDLNKTGAYKEFIDRINYIWPGTFESWKTKYKKYKEVSIEGCKKIGQGAKGEIYRYDEELIVKVYNEKNTYKDVERESALARTAFVLGLPTAISFGIVSVGARYGAMFELIDAQTFSDLIARNSDKVDYYAQIMANLAKHIHSIEVEDNTFFPDAKIQLEGWVDRAIDDEDEEIGADIRRAVNAIDGTNTLVHGDFHTNNVFLSENEPLFIDVDRMSVGNPIIDISGVYLFYVGFGRIDKKKIEDFMGFSYEIALRFYDSFIECYLESKDKDLITQINDKAKALAYIRLIGQIKKKKSLTLKDNELIGDLVNEVKELIDKYKTLGI